MKLISINVGQPREVAHAGRMVCTAIFKSPLEGRAIATELGIEGDAQADQKHHGGIHQAVYGYFVDSYNFWKAELSRDDLSPGAFGENLTIDGMTEPSVCIGDVFRIGSAKLQISQPRQPCFKLGIAMNDAGFVDRFLQSQRLGAYFRIIEPGNFAAGDKITKISDGAGQMTLSAVCRLRFFDKNDFAGAASCAALPDLSPEWRRHFRKRIDGTEFDSQKKLW